MSVYFGVDVGVSHDASAIAIWHNRRLESIETMRQWDTMKLANHVADLIAAHKPSRVCIDEIGIGLGVVNRLNELGFVVVEGIKVSHASSDPARYANLKAEIFWRFREALQKGEVTLPHDRELFTELLDLKYHYRSNGALQLESKEDMRRRLGRSPDRADAAVLGYWAASGGGKRRLDFSVWRRPTAKEVARNRQRAQAGVDELEEQLRREKQMQRNGGLYRP